MKRWAAKRFSSHQVWKLLNWFSEIERFIAILDFWPPTVPFWWKEWFFCSSKKLLRLLKWSSCEECVMIYPCSFLIISLYLFHTEKILFNTVYLIKDTFLHWKWCWNIPCTLYMEGNWERVLDSFYD